MKKALVVLSGGQDSVTCLYWARKYYDEVEAITFAYGQKHSVEVHCAQEVCLRLDTKQTIVDISFLKKLNDSAMVHSGDVTKTLPNGLPTSFVPNRNATMLTLSHMYAQKIEAEAVITGVCQTDYSGYPDCRRDFVNEMERALNLGSQTAIKIITPLMYLNKAETFKMAQDLDVLYDVCEYSHTCYEGIRGLENRHNWGYGCGICPACKLREEGWLEFVKNSRTSVSASL